MFNTQLKGGHPNSYNSHSRKYVLVLDSGLLCLPYVLEVNVFGSRQAHGRNKEVTRIPISLSLEAI